MIIPAYIAIFNPETPYLKVTRVEENGDRVLPVLYEGYATPAKALALVEGGSYETIGESPETCIISTGANAVEMIKFDDLQYRVQERIDDFEHAYIFNIQDNSWSYICANGAYVSDRDGEWIYIVAA